VTGEPEPWYRTFFTADYPYIYERRLRDKQTDREVAFARKVLDLQPGNSLLDLACGQGRHAVRLAQLGYRVTALDLNADYLEEARAQAEQAGIELETVHADMREIPFAGRFDAVLTFFTVYGYLESEEEDFKVLQAVERALKPGGRFLLDVSNRDAVLTARPRQTWRQRPDGTLILYREEFDPLSSRSHVEFESVRPDGTRRQLGGHHIRLYTLRELAIALDRAGMRVEDVFGGYKARRYTLDSPRLIIVASKPR
jgi:SAM-dependent methyltransferase